MKHGNELKWRRIKLDRKVHNSFKCRLKETIALNFSRLTYPSGMSRCYTSRQTHSAQSIDCRGFSPSSESVQGKLQPAASITKKIMDEEKIKNPLVILCSRRTSNTKMHIEDADSNYEYLNARENLFEMHYISINNRWCFQLDFQKRKVSSNYGSNRESNIKRIHFTICRQL